MGAHNRRLETRYLSPSSVSPDEEALLEGDEGSDGESLGGEAGSPPPRSVPCRLHLKIVRPSIVGPSWLYPWPGWTGEHPSTVTGVAAVSTCRLEG